MNSDHAARTVSPLRSLFTRVVLFPIHLYRATAAMRAPRCRFAPSCSTYAVKAIKVHGPFRGGWLAIKRLGRCHPWNLGGVDHVPPRDPSRNAPVSRDTTQKR